MSETITILIPYVGDFRLLDRKCINALKQIREINRYTKGVFCYIGFRKTFVEFEIQERIAGESSMSFKSLFKLAIEGILSYTTAPLRIATIIGGISGALVAIILGTKSEDVIAALNTMPEEVRNTVTEITLDLPSSMRKIARLSFPKATQVIDRFHVQKLALEALQEMRIDFRWDAIHEENKLMTEYRAALKRGEGVEPYEPPVYANGDTRKQLLARSRYLLFKSREKWTESQKTRAKILFDMYPDLETAYELTDELRRIYSSTKKKSIAYTKLAQWYRHVEEAGYDSFQVVRETVYENYPDILNIFENRSTNASAESFNSKIKNFRAQLRGVSDVKYFLFRLQNIYA